MAEEKTKDRDPFGDRYDAGDEDPASKTSKTDERSQTPADDESVDAAGQSAESATTVRDRKNVNMYLPEDSVEELQLRYAELNIAYRREHGEDMPKNKVFYPAVVDAALEGEPIRDVLAADGMIDPEE